MKKFLTLIVAVIPLGIFAQDAQEVYASADDVLNQTYADLGMGIEETNSKDMEAVSADASSTIEMYKVSDLLLADPDFSVQEDMISYTKDQKTVFFSANHKLKTKKGNQADVRIKKSVQLQMFKATVDENGEWVNLEMLPFNGTNHSTGHPALNADDTKLFFVSDGPQSTGKTDIFVVDLNGDGTYGEPQNLGPKINTEDREVFPYVDTESVLYFASDVQTDGAELDVYASKVINDELSAPVKLDVAVDSSKDEYAEAFKSMGEEAVRLAEEAADLRDLEILLEAESLSNIKHVEKTYAESLSGQAYNFEGDKVMYTVQIGAFLKTVKTGTYKDSSGLYNHQYDDGYNRFYSGAFDTYAEAEAHLTELQKDGFQDAFALGLKGQERFLQK